ncbi:spore germination protein (amino acid permease) [Mesobacillus persicus]|uniref:Spore germination protein (Amino acid permease) n=1 Tax=Mesobacillus persicus TaxID=930146 RepID=A0A1H8B1C2_9BACI|nr:GerAB/ArcD/ProY family transporter [Mesobacillus persicus]SEM76039.1 spore germination protein (amino acid permease) [Mesobacillus persicus]
MNSIVKESNMVSPYFLFFLMHSTQTGIGVLKFQSHIVKGAGHDAWVSVLAFGLLLHIIFFMMLYILKQSSNGDILSFHKDVFGKYFGGALNLFLAGYFLLFSLFAFHNYIDILPVWVFDGITPWEYSLLLSVIILYIVSGGFRIVTAISFWGVVIPSFLLLSFLYLLQYAEVSYLQPVLQYGMKDYLISAKEAAPVFLGFETILVFYPFIKNRETSSKWGHIALFYTTILYTSITIITFLFFSQGKLEHLTWPTLTMIKIITFPFLERFEFIFIFTWLLVVMPVICITMWSAIRSIKLTIPKVKPTYLLVGLLVVFHFVNVQLNEIQYSIPFAKIVNYSGLIFLFGYIPFLFLIAVIRKKMK